VTSEVTCHVVPVTLWGHVLSIQERADGSVLACHLFFCERARQRAAGRKNVLHERILRRGTREDSNRFKEGVDRASEHLLRCSYTRKKKRKMLLSKIETI
jgi:hypothetical protein